MHTQSALITLQAITFLHPGTGQNTGIVDLPIQREVHTGFPMIAGSGLKGSLRDKAEQQWGKDSNNVSTLFGSAVSEQDEKPAAGAVTVTEARILAFPVRSLQQVFVWITCPLVINRLLRDVDLVKMAVFDLSSEDLAIEEAKAWTSSDSSLTDTLILEEVSFAVNPNDIVDKVAGLIQKLLNTDTGFDLNRLVIIPDQDFQYLVRNATQISARIKLNDRKTTSGDGGNLWYEETLPPETILYALNLNQTPRSENVKISTSEDVIAKIEELCKDPYLQIGGNETVGQGWCSIKMNRTEKK